MRMRMPRCIYSSVIGEGAIESETSRKLMYFQAMALSKSQCINICACAVYISLATNNRQTASVGQQAILCR